MIKKICILIAIALITSFSYAKDTKTLKTVKHKIVKEVIGDTTEEWQKKIFTSEELEKYNGKNGMPVYNAVDGIVYDFTGVVPWNTGLHMGLHTAGSDLTEAFNNKAPSFHREKKVLEKLKKIGILKK